MNRVLIDTQALIWFAENSPILSARAISIVDDPATQRLASVASIWEMAIKIRLLKLSLKSGTLRDFFAIVQSFQVELLPVTTEDALHVVGLITKEHKDPFNRSIAAQCLRQDLTLVSIDQSFDAYGAPRLVVGSSPVTMPL